MTLSVNEIRDTWLFNFVSFINATKIQLSHDFSKKGIENWVVNQRVIKLDC